jgi:hypothetical protein
LKPVVVPHRTEVRVVRPYLRSKAADTLPCENDQAKNLIASHDWHVQPIFKDPLGYPPKRALRIEVLTFIRMSPNLLRYTNLRLTACRPVFLARLFKSIKLDRFCQPSSFRRRGVRHNADAIFPIVAKLENCFTEALLQVCAAQNF